MKTPKKECCLKDEEQEKMRIFIKQLGLNIFIDEIVSVLVDYEDPISKGTMWTGMFIGANDKFIFLVLKSIKRKYSYMAISQNHILDILVYNEDKMSFPK